MLQFLPPIDHATERQADLRHEVQAERLAKAAIADAQAEALASAPQVVDDRNLVERLAARLRVPRRRWFRVI